LPPNLTLPYTRLLFERVRSARPAPVSVTCCGLVVTLSKTMSDALCAPTASGVNATPSVHDPKGETVTGIGPHVPLPLSAYSESDGVAPEMTSELVLPVLCTVRFLVSV